MVSFDYTISDPLGIHARPAGMLAKLAKDCTGSVITLTKGRMTIKATQLMMLMCLGVKRGDTVTIAAEGGNETASLAAIQTFFQENL